MTPGGLVDVTVLLLWVSGILGGTDPEAMEEGRGVSGGFHMFLRSFLQEVPGDLFTAQNLLEKVCRVIERVPGFLDKL